MDEENEAQFTWLVGEYIGDLSVDRPHALVQGFLHHLIKWLSHLRAHVLHWHSSLVRSGQTLFFGGLHIEQ